MIESWMREIPGADEWAEAEEIPYGWSGERKLRVTAPGGERLLLRVCEGARYEAVRRAHEAMLPVNELGLNASRALGCGLTADGRFAWALLSYVPGESAEARVPLLPEAEQYALGLEAGRMLQKMHGLPAPEGQPDWQTRFNAKIDRKREAYERAGCAMPMQKRVFALIESGRPLLAGRPQSFQHGDYHIGNMVLDGNRLGVIDFNRLDYGDPYEEFNRIAWCAQAAPAFAKGRVDGYFGGAAVPREFFALMALYIANNMISTVPWAIPFGEREMRVARRQYSDMLEWYDGFRTVVPSWYARPVSL